LKVIAMLLPEHERNDKAAKRHEVVIAPYGVDASEERTFVAVKSPRRFLTIWRDRIFMTIVIIAAIMALNRFASHVAQQAQKPTSADGPNAGIIIRTEMLDVWLPQTLFERPKHQSLQQFLELHGQENIWYALNVRGHQVNGVFADILIIRRPCRDPDHLPELLDILATTSGDPPSDPKFDFSQAAVHIIAEDLARRQPAEVISELLRHPSPAADQERLP
jgi:hypothetical protein